MKTRHLIPALAIPPLAVPATARETIDARIGELSFNHDVVNSQPTVETDQKLFGKVQFQRATQGYTGAF